ncbi:MAG: hypothetical protein ACOCYE_04320 [Pseudomonadota bacterium]
MTKRALEATEPDFANWSASEKDIGDSELVFRLSLNDLQPGAGGEVVLFNDSAFRDLVIDGVSGPVERGTVRSHITAEGVDVSGFRFVRFESGVVVFHTPDTAVHLRPTRA